MSTGMVIQVQDGTTEIREAGRVPVADGSDLQARYDLLVRLVLRVGNWLMSPQAQMMAPDEWEGQFTRYQERLEELRRLGDELRPQSLRERGEPLAGDALVEDVLELFAA